MGEGGQEPQNKKAVLDLVRILGGALWSTAAWRRNSPWDLIPVIRGLGLREASGKPHHENLLNQPPLILHTFKSASLEAASSRWAPKPLACKELDKRV